jgi:hypothetical protein
MDFKARILGGLEIRNKLKIIACLRSCLSMACTMRNNVVHSADANSPAQAFFKVLQERLQSLNCKVSGD